MNTSILLWGLLFSSIGLGFFLGDNNNSGQFGHGGADEGFQAMLTMFDSGHGVAVMANFDNGIAVANYLIRSVAREYAWNSTPEKEPAADVLMLIAVPPECQLRHFRSRRS